MSLTVSELEHELDLLDPQTKLHLLDKLQDDLAVEQAKLDHIWAQEAQRRYDDIKSGKSKTIPAEQVFAELEAKYAKKQ